MLLLYVSILGVNNRRFYFCDTLEFYINYELPLTTGKNEAGK
jgi:hypothetical protein